MIARNPMIARMTASARRPGEPPGLPAACTLIHLLLLRGVVGRLRRPARRVVVARPHGKPLLLPYMGDRVTDVPLCLNGSNSVSSASPAVIGHALPIRHRPWRAPQSPDPATAQRGHVRRP